jgi:hypothetical protein
MAKDIGKKRKDREKTIREKMILRREHLIRERKSEDRKKKLEHKTRRKQEPIVKNKENHVMQHKFEDSSLPISEERNIVIDKVRLENNLQTLKTMEEEFAEAERLRAENKEKLLHVPHKINEDIIRAARDSGDNGEELQ